MFPLSLPPVPYTDPWNIDFDARYRDLMAGSPRIAYYYAKPDMSTFRYRVFNMIEALAYAAPGASAAWFTLADGQYALDAVGRADALVICRSLYNKHTAALIAKARARGVPVTFDVDDLVFDPQFAHLIMETLDEDVTEDALTHWFGWIARIGQTLRLCDRAITTNEFLAERIQAFHNVSVSVVPNFLNRRQLELSQEVMERKRELEFAGDGQIHLGYFSGTPTHNRDFSLVEPALAELLDDDPRVHLRVVGFLDVGERLRRYGRRLELVPLRDFLNLQRSIGEVEFNLVPLQDNEFTNCKSELKYFEAAAVGTVTIASPTFTLRRAISHGETGFLARTLEWGGILRDLIGGLHDLEGVRERARSSAIARFSPHSQRDALRAALQI